MLQRTLEPEVMDTEQDAAEYAAIGNGAVNELFVTHALSLAPRQGRALDLGTGPGDIAILLAERSALEVVGLDLAESMLALARARAQRSSAAGRLSFVRDDGKGSQFLPGSFELVISNSVAHHVPEPVDLFREVGRLARPGAALLLKDLLRPASEAELTALVERYAADDTPYQRELFRCSLHAALTLTEVQRCCREAGLHDVAVAQVSDRHWVVERPHRG